MAATVLRPCFGSPTAFLVHGENQFYRGKNGFHPTRCHKCAAKEGCSAIGLARLKSNPRIEMAFNNFTSCGGRVEFAKARKSGRQSAIIHAYRSVIAALDSHGPFQSVNDDRIQAYCDEKLVEQGIKDRERQRVARERERVSRLRKGEFDADFLQRMWRERVYREGLFTSAQKRADAPACLAKAGPDGALLASQVWSAKTILIVGNKKVNPSSIASELIARGWVATGNQNSLRGRVKKALTRITFLETVLLPGATAPIWDRVDLMDLMKPDLYLN
ncbi:MAG: hypothetical protein H7255_11190 [Ramlibacter sp.]|nr:hypothetical protein [Ramlibacter sp.]